MTDDQRPDDADATRRHDLPADQPAWPTPPTSSDPTPVVDSYSPPPEPRTDWTRHEGGSDPAPTPERWYEPAPASGTVTTAPVTANQVEARRSGRGGFGTVVAAALLSAVLASGGTVLALRATGSLDRTQVVQTGPTGTTVGANNQPVTVDENSATIDVAAAVSPAVVRITTSASVDTSNGIIPETGVGSGVIYDSSGWILTNRHVVEGSTTMKVELNDGRVLDGKVYGIDTLTDLAIVKIEATGLPTASIGV
jgi:putative serine protease PepD